MGNLTTYSWCHFTILTLESARYIWALQSYVVSVSLTIRSDLPIVIQNFSLNIIWIDLGPGKVGFMHDFILMFSFKAVHTDLVHRPATQLDRGRGRG